MQNEVSSRPRSNFINGMQEVDDGEDQEVTAAGGGILPSMEGRRSRSHRMMRTAETNSCCQSCHARKKSKNNQASRNQVYIAWRGLGDSYALHLISYRMYIGTQTVRYLQLIVL